MLYEIRGISLTPDQDPGLLRSLAAKKAGLDPSAIRKLWIRRRSIDARRGRVSLVYALGLEVVDSRPRGEAFPIPEPEPDHFLPGDGLLSGPIVVVGAGPCGLMAAHTLAEEGYPVLLLERGCRMGERDIHTNGFLSGGSLDPDSNVLFGEGGAGAYSDGKLTARNRDIAGRRALELLMRYGAGEEIGYDAKPHIGTDRLKGVISALTDGIQSLGGRVLFGAKLTGILEAGGEIASLSFQWKGQTETLQPGAVVLATGHSARDTYRMLHSLGVPLMPKPFAVGARIEHHQSMVDGVQYGAYAGHPRLGAAEYALTARGGDRGVYTFCMCPGGQVIPSVSDPGLLCVNGMSYHARDGENANSALIVQVSPKDYPPGPLGGVVFQEEMERRAYNVTNSYAAPTQRVEDFLRRRPTRRLGAVKPTYPLGQAFCSLDDVLPDYVCRSLREALPYLGRKLRGFDSPDAVFTGVESRTSAPVRILRNDDGTSPYAHNLYPAGEGSGYAGGIVSAGADGIRAARKIMARFASSSRGFTGKAASFIMMARGRG